MPPEPLDSETRALSARHQSFGWWSLLVFLSLGIALELLHGFKVPAYLDVANETRRHLWTLAHAHGTLLALVNLIFGLALPAMSDWDPRRRSLASRSLRGAGLLVPAGFFLGGVVFHSGDPGVGILLLPLGAVLLLVGVWLTARARGRG